MRRLIIAVAALALAAPAAAADTMAAAIDRIESGWAQANFAVNDKAAQVAAFDRLIASTADLERQAPGRAEPIVWRGVLMTAKAGVVRGFAGFRLVSDARRELERAEAIAPNAETGLGLIQLGRLYYQVPGPPIAFGNRGKARAYLLRALAINPKGLAANLAYGDFLVEGGRFAEAEPVLQRALGAEPDAAHPVADKGQRAEAEALMRTVRARLGRNG